MADVKFEKAGGEYYVVFNNDKLVKATVTLSISWDLDEKGYSVPYQCVAVKGADGDQRRRCRSGDSGQKTLAFKIDRGIKTRYQLQFDTFVRAEIVNNNNAIKIYHPLKDRIKAERETALANQNGWGVLIPGDNAVIDDSQIEIYMERVDDPNNAGTALDAVEIPSFNGKNRMSFKNQTKDSESEFFGVRSSYKTFYKFDFEGTQREPKLNKGDGDWRDGETFPEGERLEFFDGTNDDVNAFLYIRKKEFTVNERNLEGARITFEVTDKEFKEDPLVPLKIRGISNRQLPEFSKYASEQPTVENSIGNVTFSLVNADTANGFTVNSSSGVVKFTTPAYDESGTAGANDYQFKLKATDSKTPVAQTGTTTKVVTVTEPPPEPDPLVPPEVKLSLDPEDIDVDETSTITFKFTQSGVTGFKKSDVQVTNGSISSIQGDGRTRTATVTPDSGFDGNVKLTVPVGSFKNADNVTNTKSKTITLRVLPPPPASAPTLSITTDKDVLEAGQTAAVTFTFNENVSGFEKSDVEISGGGKIKNFSGSGSSYTATYEPPVEYNGEIKLKVIGSSYTSTASGLTGTKAKKKLLVDTTTAPPPPPPPDPPDPEEPVVPEPEDPILPGDPPPTGGGECGINPPVITIRDGKWGIKIPKRVLEGSEMRITASKKDDPEKDGTALKNFGLIDSNKVDHRRELNPNKEIDTENITFAVQSSINTFYKLKYLDNIQPPAYSEERKRLEFRDGEGSDANAWIEIDDMRTKFICDDLPPEPEEECEPGPWMRGEDVYYPEDDVEPIRPGLITRSGGLKATLESDKKTVRVRLTNYPDKLVTLKLTWSTNAGWDQAFKLSSPLVSDMLIDGPTIADGGSRFGAAGNEYAVPDADFLKAGEDDVTRTVYLYNADGGDTNITVSMSSTPGIEPERAIFESVGTEIEGAVAGISVRNEQGDLGDAYTAWAGSSSEEFKNNQGGDSPPNWEDGTAAVSSFRTFDMKGGKGEGLQIKAKILPREGSGGNLRNTTVQIQSIVSPGAGYSNGDYVTFPSPYDIPQVIKITAIAGQTVSECTDTGETETWTEAGGSWPRFPEEATITVNGGNKVEWVYEDGGGGPEWNDQVFSLEVLDIRETIPWNARASISMDRQLQERVWIPSTITEQFPDGEEGHSLEDYSIHSDKIRFRRPSTHSSLTNLKVGGVQYKEFRGVAGALQPQYYGIGTISS